MIVSSHRITRHVWVAILATICLAGSAWAQGSESMSLTQRGKDRGRLAPRPAVFTVELNQAAGQADPEKFPPAAFEVVFGSPIFPASFEPSDIVQNGTATINAWSITNPSNDARNFRIEADVANPGGTVIPSIDAASVGTPGTCSAASVNPGATCGADSTCVNGACAGSNQNLASVSVDNSITITFANFTCTEKVYLFVAGWSPPVVRTYCVEAGGGLSLDHTTPAPGDNRDLLASSSGQRLYYAHSDLSKFIISTDGSLTLEGSVPVGAGAFDDLTFGPDGRYVYGTHSNAGGVSNSQGTLRVYDTGNGSGLPLGIQTRTGLVSPHGVGLAAAGDQVYVANQWSFLGGTETEPEEIIVFDRNANGTVSLNFETGYLARPDYFAVHPSLPLFYSTDRPGGSVTTNQIGGGMTIFVDSTFSGFGATQLVINASGTRLYVLNNNDDTVSVFGVNGADLVLLETEATGDRPEHLVLHPNGNYLFVAGAGGYGDNSTITVYQIDGGGLLNNVNTKVIPDQGAYRLEIVDLN